MSVNLTLHEAIVAKIQDKLKESEFFIESDDIISLKDELNNRYISSKGLKTIVALKLVDGDNKALSLKDITRGSKLYFPSFNQTITGVIFILTFLIFMNTSLIITIAKS